ncbi:LysR family transcriptional regulator [Bdellovibrio svalbardensis]|uniref:LysR family transcriptional regulator n=1 Tax=Bdellovibrio svalbardensis TaxID=2972972 RepID=A0ABT6DLG4_9BACT|nr:LysR family transcriptional regulator [Bdellovibrio svalbardensis]MDG0817718.1 LysR family transcriptional regulator [Bdellovibrio svalbardensis]
MNLLHLEYFYTVATEGGFLRASEKLRINQPAISRMVANLEDYFGFKLFEKVGRNVRLTSRGEEVFESCKKIFSEVENLKLSVGKISGECKGPLLIAASEPIASHFLPEKIAAILKRYPEIYPNIFSGPASMVIKKIEAGEIELGLFFHIPELGEKLIVDRKIEIPFRLVVRKDLKKDENVLSHFIGSREIDDTASKRFPTLEVLKKKYPKASIKTSSNNLTAHKELVLKGVGVSVLPEFLIEQELKSKTLIDVLPGEKFVFHMKLIKRKNAVTSLNALKLQEEIL